MEVRRTGHPLFGRKIEVTRLHIVYDEEGVGPPLQEPLTELARQLKLELHFHAKK